MEWNIHPFKEEPLKSFFLILFLFVLTILLFLIFPNVIFVVAAMIAMIMSLRGYLFKSKYKLQNESIVIKMLSFEYKKKFKDFKRLYILKDAFFMSPFTYKTKLNKYRGIYVPFPKELKIEIVNFISEKFEDVVIKEG